MGVHTARLSDLPTIRRLERDNAAGVLSPTVVACQRSAIALLMLSSVRGVGKRTQTLVLRDDAQTRGFVQARSRPGSESWDIVRLACMAPDAETWEHACSLLLDHVGGAAAQSGALRTFVRVTADSPNVGLLADSGFRPYATEMTYRGTLRDLVDQSSEACDGVRERFPRDAWDIFSLYCAVTPALIRHAEGRSLKEWALGHRLTHAAIRRWSRPREVILGESGDVQAWIQWTPLRSAGMQVLEALVRPEAAHRLPDLVRFGVEFLGLNADCITVCRIREYDGGASSILRGGGFEPVFRETLLVRHTVARVTERQLLVAALRAQGLGIDISRYQDGSEALHHRMASSREVERQYYDQFDRPARASGY